MKKTNIKNHPMTVKKTCYKLIRLNQVKKQSNRLIRTAMKKRGLNLDIYGFSRYLKEIIIKNNKKQ